jgi:hypothetical protein
LSKKLAFSLDFKIQNRILAYAFIFLQINRMKLREELEARGLLYQMTNEKFFDIYEKG